MKSEKAPSESNKPQFVGCVEIVPSLPAFIEFVTANRLWGIAFRHFEFFVLGENPETDGKEASPPDLLVLGFQTRLVVLWGWRLEQLLDLLTQGRVKRVHAQEFPGSLRMGELWVSKIASIPRFETISL
jgi:hypothetical protein